MRNRNAIFERITSLLEEISLEKQAEAQKDKGELKPKGPDGEIMRANDALLEKGYPPQVPQAGVENPKVGLNESFPVEVGYPGDDPVKVKVIDSSEYDWEKYKKTASVSALDNSSLVRDAVLLGNSLLREIIDDGSVKKNAEDEKRTSANVNSNQLSKSAFDEMVKDPILKAASDEVEKNSIDLAAGVLYGIQKQAEHHANLVGNYLYGFLREKLEKKCAEAESVLREITNSDTNKSEAHEEKENESKAKENDTKEKNDNSSNSEEEEKSSDEKSDEVDIDKEEEETDPIKEETVVKELEEMSEPKDVNEDSTVLEALGAALGDLGMTVNDLSALGSRGAKLASAYDAFRKSASFVIRYNNPRVKRARDYVIDYIKELQHRSRRRK